MKLSGNMREALRHVIEAEPEAFTTGGAMLLRGLEALERRGLVQLAAPREAFKSPSFVLTDEGRIEKARALLASIAAGT